MFFSTLFPLLLLSHCCLAARLDPDVLKVKVFSDVRLTNLYELNTYMTNTHENLTHAQATVRYCPEHKKFALENCDNGFCNLQNLLYRLTPYEDKNYRAVFMTFKKTECNYLEHFEYLVHTNDYPSAWYGMRLVPGPYSDLPQDLNVSCLNPKIFGKNTLRVLMFDEDTYIGQGDKGYLLEQFERMVDVSRAARKQGFPIDMHAFDAFYITHIWIPNILDNLELMSTTRQVLIYQLAGQPLPDANDFQRTYWAMLEKGFNVELLLPREFVDKILGDLPYGDWFQRPALYQRSLINRKEYCNYLAAGIPYTHLLVRTTTDGNMVVNDKDESDWKLQVLLQDVVLQITPR